MKSLIVILLLISISSLNYAQMDNFDWLLGEWMMDMENSYIVESWEKISENTFEGESNTINSKNDSIIFSESLRLLKMGDNIFYIAKVPQNNLPVAFKKIFSDDKTITFENENHDFPQKIEYLKIEEDSLMVTISLIDNDKSKREFYYRRK